jgi:large subunit ribosomal protein L12
MSKEERKMEYIYAAMLLHKAGHKVTEEAVKKVLTAAGAKVDDARIKALVAALEGVNIDEAIEKAAVVQAVAAAPAEAKSEKKEDKKAAHEEEKKTEEQAAAGLGALFG